MYISVDAGGTRTRVVGSLELDSPTFVSEPLRRINTHQFDNDMTFIVDAALQLANGRPIDALGIGTPGTPNEDNTRITSAKNLASWAGKPLAATLSEGLGCPVFYDNDVVMEGLGEAYYGRARGDFDLLIWGTGIGGGRVRMEESGPEVSVLKWREHFSDWEADCGGAEMAKAAGKPPEEFAEEEWQKVAKKFQEHLERYIAAHKPPAIVFCGGVAVARARMVHDIGETIGANVEVTQYGRDSGLMGGFGLIRRVLEQSA